MTKHQLSTLSLPGLGKLRDATETEIAGVGALKARNGAQSYGRMLASLTRLLVRVNKAIAAHPREVSWQENTRKLREQLDRDGQAQP